jgi:hypothetical protein
MIALQSEQNSATGSQLCHGVAGDKGWADGWLTAGGSVCLYDCISSGVERVINCMVAQICRARAYRKAVKSKHG